MMVKFNIKMIQFNVATKAFAGLKNIILYLLVCSRSTSEDYGEKKSKQKDHLRLKEKSCQVHAHQEKKNDWSKICF